MSRQLNMSRTQNEGSLPADLKHEFVIVNAQSAPSWGGNYTIRCTEKGYILDAVLAFNINAVSGFTGTATNIPRFTPTDFFIQKIDVKQSGNIIQTIFPDANFIRKNLFSTEDDRLVLNYASGEYSSPASRFAMAATTSDYYLPLKSLFNETYLPILADNHAIEFQIFLAPLANVVTTTGLTVTALAANINNSSVILKMSKYSPQQIQGELNQIAKVPKHLRFHESREFSITAQSGVTSITIPLTNIQGKCSNMFFVMRPTTGLTLDNQFSYVNIKDFQVLDSGSTNIVGGQSITSLYNRTIQAQHWNRSFYLTDVLKSVSNAFVFQYAWSLSPYDAINSGKSLSYRVFNGSETLQINFTAALAATHEIRGYCYVQSYVELTSTSSQRIYA